MEARYQTLEKSFQGNSVMSVKNIFDFANNPAAVTEKQVVVLNNRRFLTGAGLRVT